jgi:chromosome segregation ATPase
MSAVPDTSLGRRTIGEILLEHGYVTKEQIAEATALQAESGRPLGQILVESGMITRLELASALAEQWSDSGAPIGPPPGISPLSGTQPAAEPSEPRPTPAAATPDQSELRSRIETLEVELERLQVVEAEVERLSAADEIDLTAPLRGAVEELAQRVSATEPALDEIARRLDFLVVERGDDARLAQVSEATAELQERLTLLSQRVETAAERSNDAAADAGAALERLQDEVAALGSRVTDLSGDDDVAELRALVDALSERPLRDPDLAAQIEDLQAVVEGLTQRPGKDPDLVAQIEDLQAVVERLDERPGRDQELIAQVDTLAVRMAELGDRVDVLGAGVQSFSGDADALHELQGALAELTQRPLADPAIERRVDELVALVDELAQRPASDPAVERRVDDLATVVDELAQRPAVDEAAQQRMEEIAAVLDGLRGSVDALAEKPAGDPALDEKLWEITSRLEAVERAEGFDVLRAQIAELAELTSRPAVDPALVQRLTELEHRLDAVPGDDVLERLDADGRSLGFRIDGVVARLDEMATTVEEAGTSQVSREAWDEARSLITSRLEVEAEMSSRLDQLEERLAEVAAHEGAVSGQPMSDPALEQQLTALASRMDQLASQVATVRRAAAEGGAVPSDETAEGDEVYGATHVTLERDVEHVLMAIERLSVHLGAHERALTELMGAGGIVAQVRELSARVGDLETYGGGGGGGGGDGGGAEMRAELRGLMRRLEEAEASQKSDRERVIDQLEKAAGAIDWRLQRLETARSDEPST